MSLRAIIFFSVAAFAASASLGDPAPQGGNSTAAKAADPNEVVCERQEEPGSRLASKRVCMTRSQWADQKSQDRAQLEKVQIERGMASPH